MTKCVVISPKITSKSAKFLAESLGCDYYNPYKHDKYDYSDYDTVINWGVSAAVKCNSILNRYVAVDRAVNKATTLRLLKGHIPTIEWSEDLDTAITWINKGFSVVCRESVSSSRAKDLDIIDKVEDLYKKHYVFFSKYIYAAGEMRINVFKGRVVSILEKGDKDGLCTFKLLNGEPTKQLSAMVKAVDNRLGLDYYGLDVLVDNDLKLHLLEVNSAPSLFGITSTRFVSLLKKELA